MPKVLKICQHCKKSFSVIKSRVDAKFCSWLCVKDSGHKKRPTNRQMIRECRGCFNKFATTPGRNKIFCSSKCHHKWRSKLHSGANNPNWNGGTRHEEYPPEFFSIRKTIYARDGYQCAIPSCRSNDPRICVHHIDFNKQNTSPDNLITACPSCNARANFDRELWKSVIGSFLRWRIATGEMNMGHRGSIIFNHRSVQERECAMQQYENNP